MLKTFFEEIENPKSPLYWVNRYKFTILYSILFFALGGFVLGIPFAVGGLVVDTLIHRNWDKDSVFIHTYNYAKIAGSIFVAAFVSKIFGFDLLLTLSPVIESIPQSWSEWFIYQMGQFIPIIDLYHAQTFHWEDGDKTYTRLFLLAFAWYLNFIWLPLLVTDMFHCRKVLRDNNYFINAADEDVPKFFRNFFEKANNKDGSKNLKKYRNNAIKITIAVFILFGIPGGIILYISLFGLSIGTYSTSMVVSILPFLAVAPFFHIQMIVAAAVVLRNHYVHFSKILNGKTQS